MPPFIFEGIGPEQHVWGCLCSRHVKAGSWGILRRPVTPPSTSRESQRLPEGSSVHLGSALPSGHGYGSETAEGSWHADILIFFGTNPGL